MAKENKKESKIVLERIYNVPLRKEFLKVPKYKRSKKAITALRQFLVRHMKSDKIKIGNYANLKIWEHGIKNPPHHIKIVAKKDEEGNVFAELEGSPIELAEPVKKVEKKEKSADKEDEIKEEFKKLEEQAEKRKKERIEISTEIPKE